MYHNNPSLGKCRHLLRQGREIHLWSCLLHLNGSTRPWTTCKNGGNMMILVVQCGTVLYMQIQENQLDRPYGTS